MSSLRSISCLRVQEAIVRLFVLTKLSASRMHGYELLKAVREEASRHPMAAGTSPGRLYSFLGSLERAGYIRSRWDTQGGRPRKLLSITPAGKRMLSDAKVYLRVAVGEMRLWMPEVFE